MFYDWDWSNPARPKPIYFDARLTEGVLLVPTRAELLASGAGR